MARCLSCQREMSSPLAVCPFCGAESASSQLNDQLLTEVLSLLAEKRKIEAVNVVKTTLNLSLMDAKNAVDRLEAEQRDKPVTEQSAQEKPWHAAAKDLLLKGKKLHAVKFCREQTGCSLQEANEQVEALARRQGINPRSGCFGVILVAVVFIAVAVSIAIAY